jgi:hypothetical protein
MFVSYLTGDIYVSAAKIKRLMLFKETIAVYFEKNTKHANTLVGRMQSFSALKLVVLSEPFGFKKLNKLYGT